MPFHRKCLWLWCSIPVFIVGTALSENYIYIKDAALTGIEQKYGLSARRRIEYWQQLIRDSRGLSELEKLKAVNRFFNQIKYVGDLIHWQKADYWATPVEMLVTNGGDCEDFSIAKYFTLQAIGIDENKMRLTYVKSLRLNQAHMVLSYYPSPAGEPMILDNLEGEILAAGQRRDLIPVYSFNGDGLWIAKQRGTGKRVGKSKRVGLWQDVLARMRDPLAIIQRR